MSNTTDKSATIARLKKRVRQLHKSRQSKCETIKLLKRKLAAEKWVNKALSRLVFAAKQEPLRIAAVKRAVTFKKKLAA